MIVNTKALYRRQQSRFERMKLTARATTRRPEVVGRPAPKFYGPQNKTKLPDPKALAQAMETAQARVTAATTLQGVRSDNG